MSPLHQDSVAGTATLSTASCMRGTPALSLDPAFSSITVPADVVDVPVYVTATLTNNDLYVLPGRACE
jgi:hypothetical protein